MRNLPKVWSRRIVCESPRRPCDRLELGDPAGTDEARTEATHRRRDRPRRQVRLHLENGRRRRRRLMIMIW